MVQSSSQPQGAAPLACQLTPGEDEKQTNKQTHKSTKLKNSESEAIGGWALTSSQLQAKAPSTEHRRNLKSRSGKSRDYCEYMILGKFRFYNVFGSHGNEKPAFLNSSYLMSVIERLCFRCNS